MSVVAFSMKLIIGAWKEYEKGHKELWPELLTHLPAMGLSEYRIFLDQNDKQALFAIRTRTVNYDDCSLRNYPLMQKW